VSYAAQTTIGAQPTLVNPFSVTTFPSPADRLEVVLFDQNGAIVASQRLTTPGPGPDANAVFRLDRLPACQSCLFAVRNGPGVVQDARFVSFDGNAGQTSVAFYARDRPGGWGLGTIDRENFSVQHPLPGTPTVASLLDLRVRVLDGGRVVADTAAIRPQCEHGRTPGVYCGVGPTVYYRLTGLPLDNRNLRFELLQTPPHGPAVVVDSATAPFRAGADGFGRLPSLTALDVVPASVRGRTLFGTVSYLGPFAPGERRAARESLRYAPTHRMWTVALLNGRQTLATGHVTTPATGESSYRLQSLPACAVCTIQLRDGPTVVDRATVSIPRPGAASVTRRDLDARDGTGHFLAGEIVRGGLRADKIRIVVEDPATGNAITDSTRLPRACRPLPAAQRADHCDDSAVIHYRLDRIPADAAVRVVAMVQGPAGLVPVDSRNVQTAGNDEDTLAPTLVIPAGFDGQPAGRQLAGSITAGGSFGPGALPTPLSSGVPYLVRLVDAGGSVVGSASATTTRANSGGPGARGTPLAYRLVNLPPCANCTLELVSARDMRLQDRMPVWLNDEDVSVTLAGDLFTQHLTAGPYVTGAVNTFLAKQSAPINNLEVRVLAADGHVIVTSRDSGLPRPTCGTSRNPCPRSYTASFALGHAPPSGAVTVVVRDFHTGRELARQRVTLVGGGADTYLGTLQLAFER
jgi:hypothetical protein